MKQPLDGTTTPLVEADPLASPAPTSVIYVRIDQSLPRWPSLHPSGGDGEIVPLKVSDDDVLAELHKTNDLLRELIDTLVGIFE